MLKVEIGEFRRGVWEIDWAFCEPRGETVFKAVDHRCREIGLTEKENESVQSKGSTSDAMRGRTLEDMFKVLIELVAAATAVIYFVVSMG